VCAVSILFVCLFRVCSIYPVRLSISCVKYLSCSSFYFVCAVSILFAFLFRVCSIYPVRLSISCVQYLKKSNEWKEEINETKRSIHLMKQRTCKRERSRTVSWNFVIGILKSNHAKTKWLKAYVPMPSINQPTNWIVVYTHATMTVKRLVKKPLLLQNRYYTHPTLYTVLNRFNPVHTLSCRSNAQSECEITLHIHIMLDVATL
jgi:hypothetical protein